MRVRILVAATVLAGSVFAAGASWAQTPHEGFTFRFVVDSPLRQPASMLEWVDGRPDDVLCFDGAVQDPNNDRVVWGRATGCARIVSQYPLEGGDAVLGLEVRHVITLARGVIVDDDFAIVAPLLDSPTATYTHGLTATTDVNNIRPALGDGFYRGKDGTVGVNGNMDLSAFPVRIRFDALFTIRFAR